MPSFEESVICRAPPLEVWKLLHDPARVPEWYSGVAHATTTPDGAILYLGDREEDAYPVRIAPESERSRVLIRCLITDDLYTWSLEPHPDGCLVRVRVDVAAEPVDERRDGVLASLPKLAAAAERSGVGG
ncbi:SRPBCC family protein [Haloechinothrix sp. YIM 98757]|uniref:SRPBCC family protein n=1 Tax=Haloechinothrix aidingensis TaxID=2752311 RepID=A0A838A5R1_9PSEU|nr:SRPBCC family protein [Haloechinothrix aidingensis]MBA0125110.1 SRPBCC family protein [Haloechinothrix aidingensis]